MLISSVVLFVMTFAALGLLLGAAATYDGDLAATSQDDADIDRDPAVQSKLFEQCLSEAKGDGTVTEEEYFACAYGIYG